MRKLIAEKVRNRALGLVFAEMIHCELILKMF